ncbi:hypothetical protein HDV04_005300 [Boothiomyces sp. JEL0838]|nr:hypothetical protein HDV04_005300 [Boothiomyces sp. JEL0838]
MISLIALLTLLASVLSQACSSSQKCPNGVTCQFPQGMLIGVCISSVSIPAVLPSSFPVIPGGSTSAPGSSTAPPVIPAPIVTNSGIPILLPTTTAQTTSSLNIPTGNGAEKAVTSLGFALLLLIF